MLSVNILLASIGLSYVSLPGVPVIFNFVPEILIRLGTRDRFILCLKE